MWGRCQAEEGHRVGVAAALPQAPPREAGGHMPGEQCTGHIRWWDLDPRADSEWPRTEEHRECLQRARTPLRSEVEWGHLPALWEIARTTEVRF